MQSKLKIKKVATILLAAGSSRRMGQPKQLLKFNKKSFIRTIAETALSSCTDNLYIVVGAKKQEMIRELDNIDATIVHHDHWHKGIGSSIRAGIHAVTADNNLYDGVLILLVDQPAVNTDLLNTMIKKFKAGADIVASSYADSIGVPALFSKTYFRDLEKLADNYGAKILLQKYSQKLVCIPFPYGTFDIDTQEDFKYLKEHPFLCT
jgi:molybdenum cofactor cytidylyltransferase